MIITKLLFLLSRKPNELWLFVRELIWLVHLNGQRLFHTIKPEFYSHLTPSQTSNPNWSGHLLAGWSAELTLSLFLYSVSLSRCPSRFGSLSQWTPRSKSASEYGPGSPYPLANMGLWGSLFASGFGLSSRFWTPRIFYHCIVLYFEYCIKAF